MMLTSKKCPSCIYYAEEYAQYIHATVPVCNCPATDGAMCDYRRKEENQDDMSIQD